MLIICKDLFQAKTISPSPLNLKELSKMNLPPPFNSTLEKAVCIGENMLIFEKVTDEDLRKSSADSVFFVSAPSLINNSGNVDNGKQQQEQQQPIIYLPSNISKEEMEKLETFMKNSAEQSSQKNNLNNKKNKGNKK